MRYFSKRNGFTSTKKEGSVEISEEYYDYLIKNQGQGCSIEVDSDGNPYLEWDDKVEAESIDVRIKRDILLNSSDWTQLEDIPRKIKNPYKEYRQKLRDIPQQAGFPSDVKWPDKPST